MMELFFSSPVQFKEAVNTVNFIGGNTVQFSLLFSPSLFHPSLLDFSFSPHFPASGFFSGLEKKSFTTFSL